tara:strand:- start:7 stop:126 length:120 start_codon:yes stop_codon:yes gene_type:complete
MIALPIFHFNQALCLVFFVQKKDPTSKDAGPFIQIKITG